MERKSIISAIWAINGKLGRDSEDVHALLFRETGKTSMRDCTDAELLNVKKVLALLSGQEENRTGRLTAKQEKFINDLAKRLGWQDQPERLRGFVKKYAKVDDPKWLTPSQASNVIEGLKKIAARERAEKSS